jgi:hypothetical protein
MEKGHYKYPKIYRLGSEEVQEILEYPEDPICVEEKVDGGNGMFWLDDGVLYEGSRNRNLTSDKDEKTFRAQRAFLREALKDKEINPEFIYFIEYMSKHTIKYTKAPPVLGLDIRTKHSAQCEGCGLFISRRQKEQEFNRLGIETVPMVWEGKAKDLKKQEIKDLVPRSKYYDGPAEGIVLKSYNRKSRYGNYQLFAKVVTAEFKEVNKAVFGGVKQEQTQTSKIVEQYLPDARIIKTINKLIQEDGNEKDMTLMKVLPNAVIDDLLKEEIVDISHNYNTIDFKELRKLTSHLCARVLNGWLMK